MKFVDELTIQVSSGSGGNGMVSFRREKFIPMGGPSGGDGGKGGDLIFEASNEVATLYELSFNRVYKAKNGGSGGSKNLHGANGKDLIIKLPVGTLVYELESNKLIVDLDEAGQREIIVKGGRGGMGNARFASSVRRVPRVAEKGEPGKTLKVRLELKLLADIGLVGLPNAGKSTLLRSISNAKPKVADYPFTTLNPCLGIVKPEGMHSFCVADIPGLIEGAHQGAGLGTHFLKHIERTRLLLHLVDLSALNPDNLTESYEVIQNELFNFSKELAEKPVIVAANKIDLPDAKKLYPEFKKRLNDVGVEVFAISGAAKIGIDELIKHLGGELSRLKKPVQIAANEQAALYTYTAPFVIEEAGKACLIARGAEIERLTAMTDFTSDEAVAMFKKRLSKMGFIAELASMSAKGSTSVFIGDKEFEYHEFFD